MRARERERGREKVRKRGKRKVGTRSYIEGNMFDSQGNILDSVQPHCYVTLFNHINFDEQYT